jgi:hypothetical protein
MHLEGRSGYMMKMITRIDVDVDTGIDLDIDMEGNRSRQSQRPRAQAVSGRIDLRHRTLKYRYM